MLRNARITLLKHLTAVSQSSLARTVVRVFVFQIAGRALLAVSLVVVVRWLSKSDHGVFVAAYAVMMLTGNLWSGFYDGLTRELSELLGSNRIHDAHGLYASQIRSQALLVLVLTAVIVVAARPVAILLYGSQELHPAVVAGAIAGGAAAFTQGLAVFYQAHLRFTRFGLLGFCRYAVLVAGLLITKRAGVFDLRTALLLLIISGIAPAAAAAFDVKRLIGPLKRAKTSLFHMSMFKSKGYVIAYYWLIWASFQFPLMVLGHSADNTEAMASFGLVWRLYSLAVMIAGTVDQVLLPRLARDAVGDFQRRIFRRWIRVSALPTVVLLPLAVFPVPIVFRFLFGTKYDDAVLPFQVLCFAIAVCYVFAPLNMLLAQKDYRNLFVTGVYHLAAIVLLCLLLVPRFGVLGAAIALASGSIAHVYGAGRSWLNLRSRSLVSD